MRSPIYISTELNNGSTSIGNGNYSGSSSDFVYQVPEGKIAAIARVVITITCDTTILPGKYGDGNALTNGIVPKILDSNDNLVRYLISNTVSSSVGESTGYIKKNIDWSAVCYDFKIIPDSGVSAADLALFRWTFARAGTPIILSNQEKICFTLNDDFTGLSDHRFTLQGLEAPDQSVYNDLFLRELSGL